MTTSFDFLCLRLNVAAPEPEDYDWGRLWIDPATVEWDWNFHRPLVHETFHFWQLLCSPYMARMVSAERKRLEQFESSGRVPEASQFHRSFIACDLDLGFSAEHLLESWARFWEIQVQTPLYLLEQEGVGRDDIHESMWKVADPESPFFRMYYWSSVEVAMTRGSNCALYGKPFRWMHERICQAAGIAPHGAYDFSPNKFGPSYLACVAYPSLLYASFQGDDPVTHFKEAVQRICESRSLIAKFCSLSLNSQCVEFEWFHHWESINSVVGAAPPIPMPDAEIWMPFVAPEQDFLDIGEKIFAMIEAQPPLWDPSIPEALDMLRRHGSPVAFAHMGHRAFRLILATLSAPPLMFFAGGEGLVQPSYRGSGKDTDLLDQCILAAFDMIDRSARFRRAQKAKELGLPEGAFETA